MSSETTALNAAPNRRRIGVNTAIFALATGLSRIAGLAREVVAAGYFGTTGAASALSWMAALRGFN